MFTGIFSVGFIVFGAIITLIFYALLAWLLYEAIKWLRRH